MKNASNRSNCSVNSQRTVIAPSSRLVISNIAASRNVDHLSCTLVNRRVEGRTKLAYDVDRTGNDHRYVLPRNNGNNLEQRIVVPPKSQIQPKMSETNHTTKTDNVIPQKYLDSLEEMELKIRYMKNDIEFKQRQLQARNQTNKPVEKKSESGSQTKSKLNLKQLPESLEEMELKIRYMKNDIEFKQSQLQARNQAHKTGKTSYNKLKLDGSTDNWDKIKSKLLKTATDTDVVCSSNSALSAGSSFTGSSLTSARKQIDIFKGQDPAHLNKNQSYHSPTKTTAIYNPMTNRTLPHKLSESTKQTTANKHNFSFAQQSPSRFKFVKKTSTPKEKSTSESSNVKDSILPAPGMAQSTPSKKHQLAVTRRTPTLNIQSAAKLVSKYKLKRLSPTSASKINPHFYHNPRKIFDDFGTVKGHSAKLSLSQNVHKRSQSSFFLNVSKESLNTENVNSKMKIDKRSVKTKAVLPQNKLLYKLDRRNKTNNILKQESATFGLNERMSTRHKWSKIPTPIGLRSQFKWSRTNLQYLNLQKLYWKQRFKHGYIRSSRFTSVRNSRNTWRPYKTSKPNLIRIDDVLYQSNGRKLTVARRNVLSPSSRLWKFPFEKINSPCEKNWRRQKMKLISLRGIHFNIDARGKKLCRTEKVLDEVKHDGIKQEALAQIVGEHTRLAASRVLHRSIVIAAAKFKKDNQKSKRSKQYCIFFGRFGKCSRGDNCPYIHDPNKVAMCTRFLRGKCNVTNCAFSHKASVEKMPVCLFYLRGACSRESCPYLHVKLNPSAPVCRDFLNGFCVLGDKCKKLHSFVCPLFADTGKCIRGDKCGMLHRKRKQEENVRYGQIKRLKSCHDKVGQPPNVAREPPAIETVTSAPLTSQPVFISLRSRETNDVKPSETTESVRIRPMFLSGSPSDITASCSNNDIENVNTDDKIYLSVSSPPDANNSVMTDSISEEPIKDVQFKITPSFMP
ncbi:uncharacterized protein LOC131929808 [Physella acuta]|uniref:uncharacterized protein LOC131929808 n=1 Tax=Physella acuta TaxID=109671 RepID=UPI0027DABAB5|nr:uncharacterized protein LOC131929808 [Physella acuta]XP_059142179.1 uncharacterized protein LOC131929808 [Physella acuta]XP_059142180.1 uncharacterized protein LOC131929808 [Physella acuta]